MQTFFENNNKDELIILFCGWGMDEKAFSPLKRNHDVLFVFDYGNLKFDINVDFSKYKKIILITFSAGVFMAAYLQDKLPKCDVKIAINGSLNLFDTNSGLPESSCKMMEEVSEKNYMELRKKLICDKNNLAIFNKNQPHRTIESSLQELSALKKYYNESKDLKCDYDKIFIGEHDTIIPYKNQLNAWKNHKNLYSINGGHFLFYNFTDFDEIISL